MSDVKTYPVPEKLKFFRRFLNRIGLLKTDAVMKQAGLRKLTLEQAGEVSALISKASRSDTAGQLKLGESETVKMLKLILEPVEKKTKINYFAMDEETAAEVISDFFLKRIKRALNITSSFTTLTKEPHK